MPSRPQLWTLPRIRILPPIRIRIRIRIRSPPRLPLPPVLPAAIPLRPRAPVRAKVRFRTGQLLLMRLSTTRQRPPAPQKKSRPRLLPLNHPTAARLESNARISRSLFGGAS